MALGTWVTAGIFATQLVIWCVTPDALEDWLAHSALGKNRSSGGYKTVEDQGQAFEHALVELGYADKPAATSAGVAVARPPSSWGGSGTGGFR